MEATKDSLNKHINAAIPTVDVHNLTLSNERLRKIASTGKC